MENKLPKPKATVVVDGRHLKTYFGDLTEWPQGTTKLYSEDQVLAAVSISSDQDRRKAYKAGHEAAKRSATADAARYQVLRMHVAPRDAAISMSVDLKYIALAHAAEELIDILCDQVIFGLSRHEPTMFEDSALPAPIDKALPLILRAIAALNTHHVTPITVDYVAAQLREIRKLGK